MIGTEVLLQADPKAAQQVFDKNVKTAMEQDQIKGKVREMNTFVKAEMKNCQLATVILSAENQQDLFVLDLSFQKYFI